MALKDKVADYGGLIITIAAVVSLVGGALSWANRQFVENLLEEKLADAGYVSQETIKSIQTELEASKENISDNKDYIRKTEDKVERIVQILLEE